MKGWDVLDSVFYLFFGGGRFEALCLQIRLGYMLLFRLLFPYGKLFFYILNGGHVHFLRFDAIGWSNQYLLAIV